MSASYQPVDRCERCSARAAQRVTIHTGGRIGDIVLDFCQHHYNENRRTRSADRPGIDALVADGIATVAPILVELTI